jgi:SAM-dependent methyltransferase
MSQPELLATRTAYDAVAVRYADQFRDTLDDRPVERGLLAAFAEQVRRAPAGPVVDLGCGPGHIAAHLHDLGLPVLGVDLSGAMLAIGSARYPGVRFAQGWMTRLGLADNPCSGLLSRSSVLHLPPALLPSALSEFARVLRPGGWLLLCFSATDGPEPPYEFFDHRVAGAYRWCPDHVASLLRAVHVTETARLIENPEPEDRRQFRVVSMLARKAPAA